MKKLAYFKIKENMTPYDASDILSISKKSGYDNIIVYHGENADLSKAVYKEQLLSVFRAAYRHKVSIYLSDDNYFCSGTGFGQLSSVKDLWQRVMVIKPKTEVNEDDTVICEKDGRCIIAELPKAIEDCPFGHFPDLTNPLCAEMLIETIYKPLVNEYKKFVGYEFKGFLCSRPVYAFESYSKLPYCKEVVQDYSGDLFSVVEQNGEEYLTLVRACMEKNFVLPIKKYCDEHNMELVIETGENSVSLSLCQKENITALVPALSSGNYCPRVESTYDALYAYSKKAEPVVKIGFGMSRNKNIEKIFKEYPDCICQDVTELTELKGDCYVLTNSKRESITLGLLLEGEWCIYDWEKDELYDFEQKTDYTFNPESFLCIVKKTNSMYTDKLPARIGSVITWDFEECDNIAFEKRDNKYAFYLPDEPLSEKAIMFKGKADCIKAKLGAMEYELLEKVYIAPLFDFQRDAGCLAEAIDGEIEEIVLITKRKSL